MKNILSTDKSITVAINYLNSNRYYHLYDNNIKKAINKLRIDLEYIKLENKIKDRISNW